MQEQTTYEYKEYTFSSKDEYLAAYLDGKKITYLTGDEDIDYPLAKKVLKRINREHISFETTVGGDFLDEIQDCIEQYQKNRKRRTIKVCCYVILIACVGFFTIDGLLEFFSRQNMRRVQNSVNELKEYYEAQQIAVDGDQKIASTVTNTLTGKKIESEEKIKPQETRIVLPQYQELYQENVNFNGWLSIEGTKIDYPVMWGPDNKFYLSHNMERKYDKNGMLIMDTSCSQQYQSPLLVIYGHNVQSGRMFGELLNYKDQAYYHYHPEITYDSLYESNTYQIVATVIVSMEKGDDDKDAFYHYTHFNNEKEYSQYIDMMKRESLYETDCEPHYGDELIALVTCEYSKNDGRLVVLAAKRDKDRENKGE